MSDYVSDFDWEMQHLEEIDWTAYLEGPTDDIFGPVWNDDPVPEQPDEG